MDYTGRIVQGESGELVCRPAVWIDVVKFFLLNYVLHAFTVVTPPGSGGLESMLVAISSIVMPFSGIVRAIVGILKYSQGQSTHLNAAHRAGALCMVVPAEKVKRLNRMPTVLSHKHHVFHGYYRDLVKRSPNQGEDDVIVMVPPWFKVKSLEEPEGGPTNSPRDQAPPPNPNFLRRLKVKLFGGPEESHTNTQRDQALFANFSFLTALIAILQILYGCFELYSARGKQLERFGYAAYSLSVIPYILMSLSNLISSLFTPQFPTFYFVHYGGISDPSAPAAECQPSSSDKIEVGVAVTVKEPANSTPDSTKRLRDLVDGAVGEAYGDFSCPSNSLYYYKSFFTNGNIFSFRNMDQSSLWMMRFIARFYKTPKGSRRKIHITFGIATVFALIVIPAPEYIIYILTRFDGKQSTGPQKAWTISWLVIGQYFGPAFLILDSVYLGIIRRVLDIEPRYMPRLSFIIRVYLCLIFVGLERDGTGRCLIVINARWLRL
ncbi:uncharacterized protein LAJ45_08967 [Morchella importuna]|uniref:uncharacterized protein n=1 Tax=Morchella importuna TaxID=1174673 RepID=UPI001E8DA425|nr:uncharacterized protein LAJ45_08967 [Morchella importuna]KAH8146888.1 hypothetical protein LAJ45_08967 [Morchella importuna]